VTRRKIVFVIVEGVSDEEALGAILSNYYDKNSVYFHIMRCDITTQKGVRPDNILSRITKVIKDYANNNFVTKVHFQEIIHITDTDGAYISNDQIVEDVSRDKPHYSITEIRCNNPQNIVDRNIQKRANLDKLSSTKAVWGSIPYQIYYMSCNLDHVLYNKLNSSNEEKERDALQFARKYKSDIEGFIRFISASDFTVHGDYKQSWNYIKEDNRSLERHTNFGLCFNK
jgi:hypothetical protein